MHSKENKLISFPTSSYVQFKKLYEQGDQRFEEHIRAGPMTDSTAASERPDFDGIDDAAGSPLGAGAGESRMETVERSVLAS